jgi:murein DD-endopeptidase MepM/ murein hydrolase activator NlpD
MRVTTLFLACVTLVSVVAVAPAQAACRPTTLADLFPVAPATTAPAEVVPPAPLISTTTTTISTTTTTSAVVDPNTTTTIPTVPVDPGTTTTTVTTLPIDPATTTTTTSPVPAPTPVASCSYVYRMQWPVLGGGAVLSVFGSDRDMGSRHHAGVDISAPKMTPVVAVRDGTITAIHAGPPDCCSVAIAHDDGWSSFYLHLNNDLDGSDDGDGVGVRSDLVIGSRVVAGEVIGWVGDSGNAEPTTPHLHFELHMRNGVAIDPLASLRWAFRRMPAPALEFGPSDFSGPYIDDDGLPAETMFGLLTSLGVVSPCDPWNAAVCPHSEASTVDAVGWVSALSRVVIPVWRPTTSTEIIGQIIHEARTCPAEGCPPPSITLGEAAAIVLWVQDQRAHEDALFILEDILQNDPALVESVVVPPAPQPYWMTEPSVALARLVDRGLADSCPITTPTFGDVLTRAELAEVIGKAFGYLPVVACGAVS